MKQLLTPLPSTPQSGIMLLAASVGANGLDGGLEAAGCEPSRVISSKRAPK